MAFKWQKILVFIGLIPLPYLITLPKANAAIVDGSFEENYIGWELGGANATRGAGFGITPTDGLRQSLSTNGAGSPSMGIQGLEGFLNVPTGIFNDPVRGTAVQGSAIYQDFFARPEDTISLDWNFLTDDTVNNDYAFVFLTPVSNLGNLQHQDLITLGPPSATLITLNPPTSGPVFVQETGYQNLPLSFAVTNAGNYRLAIGVIDTGNDLGDSGVLVDNVQQIPPPSDIPESNTVLGLLSVGTLLLGFKMFGKNI